MPDKRIEQNARRSAGNRQVSRVCSCAVRHPHWRGKPAMTAVAKHLARSLNVLLEKRIVLMRHDAAGWVAELKNGETVRAGAVLLTPPVPQSLALLDAGLAEVPAEERVRLESIEYDPCLAAMLVLDGPSRIPPPGNLSPRDGPIAWIADNQMKGASATPAVTIHATAAFSRDTGIVTDERSSANWCEPPSHGWVQP